MEAATATSAAVVVCDRCSAARETQRQADEPGCQHDFLIHKTFLALAKYHATSPLVDIFRLSREEGVRKAFFRKQRAFDAGHFAKIAKPSPRKIAIFAILLISQKNAVRKLRKSQRAAECTALRLVWRIGTVTSLVAKDREPRESLSASAHAALRRSALAAIRTGR